MNQSAIRVRTAIESLKEELDQIEAFTTKKEFQTVLKWLADFVEANRSEEPA